MPEVATIGALQLDVTGFTETNIHWTQSNRDKISNQLNSHIGNAKVICASNVTTKVTEGYQPGGSMLAVVGPQKGRVMNTGHDPWGRFAWTEMRGSRDEGILVISAYRVCQTKGTKSGPKTAYTQQLNAMIQDGDLTLDPRSRLLTDLKQLIINKRQQGFRPILMMDANDDWVTSPNTSFRKFLDELKLEDPLYNKFKDAGLAQTTYARGSRRIDYIFVDPIIAPAIKRIGTLGLNEGIVSDHVMLYMDVKEDELFRGILNRPVLNPARELVIEQADKCDKFIQRFKELAKEKKFAERIVKLRDNFKLHGASEININQYIILDTELTQCILSAAATVAKKKFGYQRSPDLTQKGLAIHFWKATLSSKYHRRPLGPRHIDQAIQLGIDIFEVRNMTKQQTRIRLRIARTELWEVQKHATEKRLQWLERNAQDVARAAGEIDWKKKMTSMVTLTKERSVNRKMTAAIKGAHRGLDWIEIPKYTWIYSKKTKELYKYDQGVFEAYAAKRVARSLCPTNPTTFYKHHHLKVPLPDACPADVTEHDDYFEITNVHPHTDIWQEVTNPKEIERIILQRNRRHLQQASVERGRIHDPFMQSLIDNDGINDIVDAIKSGKKSVNTATDEAINAWTSALLQTAEKMKLPPITGEISPDDLQSAYKAVSEKTSSSPSGLHYSIWKTLAREDDIVSWLSIMTSLPFMYGFTHPRWEKLVDVMLEKKKNVRKIHQLRIIGIMEADFNTALKIIFARKLMTAAEYSGTLNDEQWGSRSKRTATDAALRKMLTFEYGRYMKATIALFANDQTACFDRMWPELTNVIAGVSGCDANVLKCRSKVMNGMNRHIKTAYGISAGSYTNPIEEPKLKGEIQGKGDVASLWAMTSSTLLTAHQTLYQGIHLPSVVSTETHGMYFSNPDMATGKGIP